MLLCSETLSYCHQLVGVQRSDVNQIRQELLRQGSGQIVVGLHASGVSRVKFACFCTESGSNTPMNTEHRSFGVRLVWKRASKIMQCGARENSKSQTYSQWSLSGLGQNASFLQVCLLFFANIGTVSCDNMGCLPVAGRPGKSLVVGYLGVALVLSRKHAEEKRSWWGVLARFFV